MAQHSTESSRFEGLPAGLQDGSGGYSPGTNSFNASLARELAGSYAACFRFPQVSPDSSLTAALTAVRDAAARLRSEDAADGQGFLDAVVAGLAEESVASDYTTGHHLYYLLSPLLSALYAGGHSMLELDMGAFTYGPRLVGDHISAAAGRPFSLTYTPPDEERGVSFSIGNSSQWCSIHVRGRSNAVGFSAEHCTFFLDEMAAALGDWSSDCSYCLADAYAVSFRPDPACDNILFADIFTSEGIRSLDLRGKFFDKGNSLLIPDGSGSWKEVRP